MFGSRCGPAQLSLLLIYAVATAMAPWACGEDGKMVSNPEIECDTSKSSDYGTMLGASILLALVGCVGVLWWVLEANECRSRGAPRGTK